MIELIYQAKTKDHEEAEHIRKVYRLSLAMARAFKHLSQEMNSKYGDEGTQTKS